MKIVLMSPDVKMPERSMCAAGYDLFTPSAGYLTPGLNKIPLKIKLEIPTGYYGRVACRSSLAAKSMSIEAGVIDEDYRGEIIVVLRYRGERNFPYVKHFKIAQIIITPYHSPELEVVETLHPTVRGSDGFGSTDSTPSASTVIVPPSTPTTRN